MLTGTEQELLDACASAEEKLGGNVAVLMTIANVFAQKNYKFNRIEQLYKQILKIDPRHYVASGQLAHLYHRRNDTSNALKYYKRAIEVHPEFEFTNQYFLDFMKRFNEQFDKTPPPDLAPKNSRKKRAQKKQ